MNDTLLPPRSGSKVRAVACMSPEIVVAGTRFGMKPNTYLGARPGNGLSV